MKLNYKRTICVGFAFFLICAFWQAYDNTVPLILTNKFGMSQAWSGVIMALDNILALFLLPLFGAISDKHSGKRGRRTPFILIGTIVAAIAFISLSLVDDAQLKNLDGAAAIDDPAALRIVYQKEADRTLKTPDGETFVLEDTFTEDEFAAITSQVTNAEGKTVTNHDYTNYVVPARQAYAHQTTLQHPGALIGFIALLLVVLVAMATFRSPAVALMPDVTIKPLRSKANAVINLMGTGGGILVLAIGMGFATSSVRNSLMSYTAYFSVIAGLMVLALLIFRLGAAIPVPYINSQELEVYLAAQSGTILGLMNAMSGSAFSMATLFALSIQPYINSSIIIQLLTVAIPALERMAKEGGEEGRKKIASITRYTTVAIGLIQGFGYYSLINSYGLVDTEGLPALWVGIVIVLSFTAGSAFLMWLGEQITEFGIGNGISIILFAGIVSRFPHMVSDVYHGVTAWMDPLTQEEFTAMNWSEAQIAAYQKSLLAPWMVAVVILGMLALVVFIVFISNAERRLPVQYAKRVVGRKMYGGQSTHIPIKVNMSGVMPIIFAQSIASLPATIGAFAGWTLESQGFGGGLMRLFDTSKPFYSVLYFLLIVGFSYFYATMQFNPIEVANNLKKNGGFIPGFRPGKPTADFILKVLNKITMFGALYLSVIAIAPIITGNLFGYSSLAIGGTSVIIVVGVALETVKQMEAQMLMRHYKGFLE